MLISDLSYLETVSNDSEEIKGGAYNWADVYQYAYASAGNNYGSKNVSIGNVALALNIAPVVQIKF